MVGGRLNSAAPIRIGMTSDVLGFGSATHAAAHVAHMHGAEFFFFKAEDIDAAGETILGHFFRNEAWEKRRTPFPDVVANVLANAVTTEAWRALERACRMTTPYLGGKMAIEQALRRSGAFDDLLIPTARVESADHIVDELARHQRVVVKPEFGNRGRDIVYVAEQDGGFHIRVDGTDQQLALPELKAFFAKRLGHESYIVQQYVVSRTALGLPFDIRIHVRRDGNAQWRRVYINARIGSGTTIAANLATGGSFANLEPFLKHRFGAAADQLYGRIKRLTRDFPPAFQALYPGRTIPALGLDVGIDEKGDLRLFEVNSNPSPQFAPFMDHMWRIAYAIYLVKNPHAPDGVIRGD